MIENHRLADFLELARPELERRDRGVLFKHSDGRTTGVADVSYTNFGMTSWWEFKVDRGTGIIGTGLQKLTTKRLSKVGFAWYVVYDDPRASTHIVHPDAVVGSRYTPTQTSRIENDHQFVLNFFRSFHTRGSL